MNKYKFDMNVAPNALQCPDVTAFYSKCYVTEDITDNFFVIPGVKYQTKVSSVHFNNLLTGATCSWNDIPTNLSAVTFSVESIAAMASLCRHTMESTFLANKMAKGASGPWFQGELSEFIGYYYETMSNEIHSELAQIMWQGNKASGSTYLKLADGYETRLSADTSVIKVTGQTITNANILSELIKAITALPSCLKFKKKDLRIYMSPQVALAYQIATASGNTIAYLTEQLNLTFLGIKITVQQMADNKIVVTHKMNMVYLVDGEEDADDVRIVDMANTTNEDIIRAKALLKVGYYILNGNEIVFYRP